ncbi:MAG: YbaK/EbsC family protein [Actinobacteria bacterium]|nr:YbaK/EbsC family protein [Actinomycetota bacterium]
MADGHERFVTAARELGIEIRAVAYPEGTGTAEDAARAIGCEVDQIVKSLVFVAIDDDGTERPVVALTSGSKRVDEAALAQLLGVPRVRKADADEVRTASGFSIGGTPPFGHARDIPVYLDPHLATFDEVWAAAGTARHVFPLTPEELRRTGAQDIGDFTS